MPVPLLTKLSQTDLRFLQTLQGSTQLRMAPSQVLVYRDHRSPGVFVLLAGRIEVPEERGQRRPSPHRLEALPSRPIVVPGPDAVDEPFAHTWEVVEAATVLFIPRSLLQGSPDLQKRLRDLVNG